MSARLAPVVSLDAARARRGADGPPTAPPATLTVRSGCVVVDLGDGTGLELSPDHARAWAERLLAKADVADREAARRERGGQ